MKTIISQYCIKGKPKFNLKDCLSSCDASRLVDLADKQHLLVNMGAPFTLETLNIKTVNKDLYIQIHDHFETDLFYLPPREIEFVSKLMCSDIKIDDNIDYEDCKFLHALGYVYLYEYNGKVYTIMPKELKKIYKAIPQTELEDEVKLNNRLYSYAISLTQIHGAYPVEHFADVWNKYNEDKIDIDDATWYLDMMYDRQDYFSFDYFYVVTTFPNTDYGYKLVRDNPNKHYRIPAKHEIEFYSKERLGKDSPYLRRAERIIL